MTASVESILHKYDKLTDHDKREVAAEIIRRSLRLSLPPLTDEELVLNAEDVFAGLDQREAADDNSQSRRGVAR